MRDEFEKVLDDIVTSKLIYDFAKRNVEDAHKRFNDLLKVLDVENLVIDADLRQKIYLANDILQEYATVEEVEENNE